MDDNVKQMLKIEPRIAIIAASVIFENERAKTKRIYWHDVWKKSKQIGVRYVGVTAEKEELRNRYSYDLFHDYLKSIATNCV